MYKQLILAAQQNNIQKFKQLLKEDSFIFYDHIVKAIFKLNSKNSTPFLKILLEETNWDVTEYNNWAIYAAARSNNAVIHACKNGHIEVVKLLINDKRVNPAANGNMALWYTANNNHPHITQLLLKQPKVNPTAKNNEFIREAIKNNNLDVAYLLWCNKRVQNTLTYKNYPFYAVLRQKDVKRKIKEFSE
jgi:ankyrin repeat protein